MFSSYFGCPPTKALFSLARLCFLFSCILTRSTASRHHEVATKAKSVLLDPSTCPLGWQPSGDICVKLFFNPMIVNDAKAECENHGATLVNVIKNQQEDTPLINDIADLIENSAAFGVAELTWLVGDIDVVRKDPQLSYNLYLSTKFGNEQQDRSLALQQKTNKKFEITTVSDKSSHPYVCALLPFTRKTLLYKQTMYPRGAPVIIEEPNTAYHYSLNPEGYFVTLPCKAIGNPIPHIKWFKSGIEEINLEEGNSSYVISGGSLLVPIDLKLHDSVTYHCTASNVHGTVRSSSTVVRSAFIEPFRKIRLNMYPLNVREAGTRIECQAPRHYPKSHSFAWMINERTDRFISQSERIFISMDGTLYFSYNLREDETSYACSLTLPSLQSGHYGPFFRLLLPTSVPGLSGPPRIDEFQPTIFPEIPTIGQAVYIECFAYGYPVPKYKWTRVDGIRLSSRHHILSYGRVLKIDTVASEDAGRYKCFAQNEFGSDSAEVQLIVHTPPKIISPLVDQMIATNTSTTFECLTANSNSLPSTVEWFYDGNPLAPLLMPAGDRHRFKVSDNALTILNAQQKDSGIYQCVASNEIGSASSTARLTVENVSPQFHGNIFPRKVFVVEGSKLMLPCLYQATPLGFAQWYSTSLSDALTSNEDSRIRQKKINVGDGDSVVVLEISQAEKRDEGTYHCETGNGVGEARGMVEIKVISHPHFVVRPQQMPSVSKSKNIPRSTSKVSCEVELACEKPEDCPEALFDWQFNDKPLKSLVTRGAFLKTSISEKEAPAYAKEASERVGRWLFSGESAESNDHSHKRVRQTSNIEVDSEFISNNVGRFSCNSVYGTGSAEVTEQKMSASAPTHFEITDIRETQVKLSWKQPAAPKRQKLDAATHLNAYEVEYRTSDNRQWRRHPNGLYKTEDRIVGSFILQHLQPNKKYQFRVRSLSADGSYSPPSAHSAWIETPQSPPLSSVHQVQWRTIDDTHLLLEWDPVELKHYSGPNLRYNVTWSDAIGTTASPKAVDFIAFAHTQVVEQPSIVISLRHKKLMKKMNASNDEICYTLSVGVQPFNDVGRGPSSTDTVVHISTDGPKRVADKLHMIPVNSTHLNLTWEWHHTGECENVYGAQIQCSEVVIAITTEKPRPATTFQQINQSVPANYSSWLVHSLRPGTEYSCTVRAFDQYGRFGRNSKHVAKAKTLDPAPYQAPEITRIKMHEYGDSFTTFIEWTSIQLRTSLFSNRTSSDRGYKIFIYVSETANEPIVLSMPESELQNARKPSARIDGLRLMYFYTIQVAGYNEGGIGPPSKSTSVRLGTLDDLAAAPRHGPSLVLAVLLVASYIARISLLS